MPRLLSSRSRRMFSTDDMPAHDATVSEWIRYSAKLLKAEARLLKESKQAEARLMTEASSLRCQEVELSLALEDARKELLTYKYKLQVRGIIKMFISKQGVQGDPTKKNQVEYLKDIWEKIILSNKRFRDCLHNKFPEASREDIIILLCKTQDLFNQYHHAMVNVGDRFLIDEKDLLDPRVKEIITCMAHEVHIKVEFLAAAGEGINASDGTNASDVP
ncbi:hypothetical protein GOP47_0005327 [Adiantum capillus-veneris]|uniref:Uncharacterized protein n=1 Tax=Adiantum capillus-veneris TaxID=13818 RepID=A0A9D4V613_ADICA|nr:hypothetical protein GOP47_0005327 [Adiantum capillus-veneris]